MAFIGNTNTTQAFTPAIDYFSGNASTTAFTLSRPVASVAQVQVVVNNVAQNPSSAYTVSGNTITFTSAPSSGTNNIYVYYTSPITQVIAPGQGTVNTTSLGNITNIASGNSSLTLQTGTTPTTALTINTSQNVGIGTSSPVAGSRLAVVGGGTQISGGTSAQAGVRFQTVAGVATITGINNDNNAYNDIALYAGASEGARLTTGNNFQFNSGYGSVATAYGCRAWVNFNGTTASPSTIRGSGNVSSVTKNSTGDYTVNFTTAMPDANYSFQGTGSQVANNGTLQPYTLATYLAGSVRCVFFDTAAYRDPAVVSVAIFR